MKFQYSLIIIGLLSFCLYFSAQAQDYIDFAQQFSQREITGSARMQGMGGLSSSLGGDITSVKKNPAGLGFFNRSELSFSPSLSFHNSKSKSIKGSSKDFKTNFNFGHLGVVLNNTKQKPEGAWRGGSFGISMNRINDFYMQGSVNGFESDYSFINYAVNYLNEGGPLDIADLAYETTMIYYDEDGDFYHQDVVPFDSPDQIEKNIENRQTENFITKGATYETTFSYGGNFNDKVYFGLGVSFVSLSYQIERRYSESPLATDAYLRSFTLNDYREIEGSGINLSLGVIYRPVSQLTIGLAYSSPTYYHLEERASTNLTANFFDDGTIQNDEPIYFAYNFDLKTSSVFNTGLTYFFGKNGFITADLEFLNYGNNKYSVNDGGLEDSNTFIRNNFATALNYKIGGEYRFNIFRVRAGYAYFDDPVKNIDQINRSRHSFSIGGGLRLRDYFIDVAVINTQYETNLLPMYIGGYSTAFDNNSTRAMLTFGFNF